MYIPYVIIRIIVRSKVNARHWKRERDENRAWYYYNLFAVTPLHKCSSFELVIFHTLSDCNRFPHGDAQIPTVHTDHTALCIYIEHDLRLRVAKTNPWQKCCWSWEWFMTSVTQLRTFTYIYHGYSHAHLSDMDQPTERNGIWNGKKMPLVSLVKSPAIKSKVSAKSADCCRHWQDEK